MGGRGRDAETHRVAWIGGEAHRGGEMDKCTETQRCTEMWNKQSHIHMWWIKIRRDTLGLRDPSHRPDHLAQDSSDREISPHNFWLYKPVGLGVVEEIVGFSRDSS